MRDGRTDGVNLFRFNGHMKTMRCNYISMPLTKLLGDSVCTPGQLQSEVNVATLKRAELAASEMMAMF